MSPLDRLTSHSPKVMIAWPKGVNVRWGSVEHLMVSGHLVIRIAGSVWVPSLMNVTLAFRPIE